MSGFLTPLRAGLFSNPAAKMEAGGPWGLLPPQTHQCRIWVTCVTGTVTPTTQTEICASISLCTKQGCRTDFRDGWEEGSHARGWDVWAFYRTHPVSACA